MSDIRNYVCESCELPLICCGCPAGESKPVDIRTPADEPERGEPTCDLCPTGRYEEKSGNGCTEWVCDRCGHFTIDVHEYDDDELHCKEEPVLRVNLIEAAKLR